VVRQAQAAPGQGQWACTMGGVRMCVLLTSRAFNLPLVRICAQWAPCALAYNLQHVRITALWAAGARAYQLSHVRITAQWAACSGTHDCNSAPMRRRRAVQVNHGFRSWNANLNDVLADDWRISGDPLPLSLGLLQAYASSGWVTLSLCASLRTLLLRQQLPM
jgi:hypothetical protein